MSDFTEGLVYRSAVSGIWYENPKAAGTINAMRVDGELFIRQQPSKEQMIEAILNLKPVKHDRRVFIQLIEKLYGE
jgi:hypothetical protein